MKQTPKAFCEWIDGILADRELSERELLRRADLSSGVISRARNGYQPIGYEACDKIADYLGVSSELVFRLAGLLPKPPDFNPEVEMLAEQIETLPSDDQDEIKKI